MSLANFNSIENRKNQGRSLGALKLSSDGLARNLARVFSTEVQVIVPNVEMARTMLAQICGNLAMVHKANIPCPNRLGEMCTEF